MHGLEHLPLCVTVGDCSSNATSRHVEALVTVAALTPLTRGPRFLVFRPSTAAQKARV